MAGLHVFPLWIALPSYKSLLPNVDLVRDCQGNPSPALGHVRASGGGARNDFGAAFAAAGYSWTQELCQADTDGDGRSNGLELGDPECIWVPGGTPQFDTGITHPGMNCGALECDGTTAVTTPAAPAVGCAKYSAPTTGSVDFTFANHTVAAGTSYVKGAFTWPESTDSAVLKFEIVNKHPDVVHHMLLYRCTSDMSGSFGTPSTGGGMDCYDVLMAWAVGGKDFCTPEDIGFFIKKESPYFILEIHYDNPRGTTGIVDESGMRLHFVPAASAQLQEAHVVLAGAILPRVQVPPGRASYHAAATISADMLGMPEGFRGVEVFAGIHHMHQIGRKQWLNVIDADTDALDAEMMCNTNYDFDLQEATYLPEPFLLRPGKKLVLDCIYDSTSRDWLTHGGDESNDEMCIIALMYTGPAAENRLLSHDVQLFNDPNNGAHVCHRTSEVGSNGTKPCGNSSAVLDDLTALTDEAPFNRGRRLLLVHAGLMLAAWGFFIPLGATVPVFWRTVLPDGRWFKVHRMMVVLGLTLTMAGLTSSVTAVHDLGSPHFGPDVANGHRTVGLVMGVLAVMQWVGALLRPHKETADDAGGGATVSPARRRWFKSHRLGAMTLVVLSVYQVITGLARLDQFFADDEGVPSPHILVTGYIAIVALAIGGSVAGGLFFSRVQKDSSRGKTIQPNPGNTMQPSPPGSPPATMADQVEEFRRMPTEGLTVEDLDA